jgi:hypothetical protein
MDIKLSFYKSASANVADYVVKYGNTAENLDQQVVVPIVPAQSTYRCDVFGLDPAVVWFFGVVARTPLGLESDMSALVNTNSKPLAPSQFKIESMI